jgi:hypothetical protein
VSRPARRDRVDHTATADRLKAHPGMWMPVGTYPSSHSADGTINNIATGSLRGGRGPSKYQPAGAFEARVELTENGFRVVARYTGGDAR